MTRRTPATIVAVLALVTLPGRPAPAAGEFPPNVAVTPATLAPFQNPTVAIDPTDGRQLAVSYQEGLTGPRCDLARSRDGGWAWSTRVVIGPGGQWPVPTGFDTCRDTVVAYGPDGSLYYLAQVSDSTNGNYSQLFMTVSADGGTTFGQPVQVRASEVGAPDNGHLGTFQPAMAVDPVSGRVYVTWLHYDVYSLYTFVEVASSGDHGATFTAPLQLSAVDPNQNQQSGSVTTAVDAAGRVSVAWVDATAWRAAKGPYGGDPCPTGGCPPFVVLLASSSDQGASFGQPVVVDAGVASGVNDPWRFSHLLALAAGAPGQLSLAWWEPQDGLNRVMQTASADGGATWRPPSPVGAAAGTAGHEQDRPMVSMAPGGRVDVAFYDLAPVQGGTRLQDVYVASAPSPGAAFAPPRKLSTAPSDTSVGPPAPPGFGQPPSDPSRPAWFGRHLGIASGRTPVVAWTDSRRGTVADGKQDVYLAWALPPG